MNRVPYRVAARPPHLNINAALKRRASVTLIVASELGRCISPRRRSSSHLSERFVQPSLALSTWSAVRPINVSKLRGAACLNGVPLQ